MDPKSIRRVALADVDETVLRDLIDHGEDLYVERKQQPPATEALGAEVASMANMLGGWLLIGVANDKRLVGWQPEKGDLQSHFGHLLRQAVDPMQLGPNEGNPESSAPSHASRPWGRGAP